MAEQRAKPSSDEQGTGEDRRRLLTLKPDLKLPRGYLSKSAVEMYLRCGKQYEFRYIHDQKSPPSVALVEGSSHGEAHNLNNEHYIKHSRYAKKETVLEKFQDEFADRSKEIPKKEWAESGEKPDSIHERGQKFIDLYFKNFASKIKPTAVEQRIEVDMGGVPILGHLDLVEKGPFWDYKVVGKSYSQKDADADLQFSFYSKGTKKRTGGFICMVKTAEPKIVQIKTERTDGDIKAAEAVIKSVSDSIKKGAFPMANPKDWWCSRRFCGFWKQCRGKYVKN